MPNRFYAQVQQDGEWRDLVPISESQSYPFAKSPPPVEQRAQAICERLSHSLHKEVRLAQHD